MTTLDKVTQMQQEQKSDVEIMAQLQSEGVAPAEIDDALNQAKIKNAVSPPEQAAEEPAQNPETQGMQPSIVPEQPAAQQTIQPQSPEAFPPQGQQQDYYQQTPQAYSDQDVYAPQGSFDVETISEIAEQVAQEKLDDYKTKTGDMASFKGQIQDKVNDIDDRLKKIESSIAQLQQAIIGKIGEFGESSAMIHKDLNNLHGTMAKLMNPLIDNVNEMKKSSK
jgi:uncharacterized protein YukE